MTLVARAIALALGSILSVAVLHTVVSPLYGAYRYDSGPVLLASTVAVGGLVGLTLLLARLAGALEARPWVRRPVVAAVLAILLHAQLQVGWAIRIAPGWDASAVAGVGERLALGLPDDPSHQLYVGSYPNNALLIAVHHVWDRLALAAGRTDLWTAGVVLVALAMTSAVALAYLAARRLGGPVTAYLTLALSLVFVGVSPWAAVSYSDTLTMPFPAAVLYLFSLERGASRVRVRAAMWCAMAAVSAVGYALKPTAVFALAAGVLVALVAGAAAGRGRWRALGAYATAVAVGSVAGGVLVGQVVATWGIAPVEGAEVNQLNVTHFLKMGAQQRPGPHNDYFGAYLESDVAETRAMPVEERTVLNVERYLERVEAMGPVGYARFLERKAAWTLGDGSFFAWSEGGMMAEPTPWLATDPGSVRIQRWVGLHGDRYAVTFSVWQGTWLVVLLLVAAAAVSRTREQVDPVATMARASLLMLIAFLLLFEARSRYLYLYLPYFLALAGLSLSVHVPAVTRGLRRRVRPAG